MVTDKGTKLDQALYTKVIAIEVVSSFDVRKDFAALHMDMDLLPRQ